jgi:hypothetical protein
MTMFGGCYRGELRFAFDGPVRMKGLCLCKTCQQISGGAGNLFLGILSKGFRYTKGEPRRFAYPGRPDATTREFCGSCGVHVAARSPKAPEGMIIKIGALDDPGLFAGPDFAVWTEEKQSFHVVPEGVRAFARLPTI